MQVLWSRSVRRPRHRPFPDNYDHETLLRTRGRLRSPSSRSRTVGRKISAGGKSGTSDKSRKMESRELTSNSDPTRSPAHCPLRDVFSDAWPPPQNPATLSREVFVSRPRSSTPARRFAGDPACARLLLCSSGVRRPGCAETHLTRLLGADLCKCTGTLGLHYSPIQGGCLAALRRRGAAVWGEEVGQDVGGVGEGEGDSEEVCEVCSGR